MDGEGWATDCALWLWVHSAAFGDVWEALHAAAAGAGPPSDPAGGGGSSSGGGGGGGGGGGRRGGGVGGAANVSAWCAGTAAGAGPTGAGPLRVSIRSRCSELRRVEVVGAGAGAALARVLRPLPASAGRAGAAAAVGGGAAATAGPGGAADSSGDASLGARIWRSAGGVAPGSAGGGGGAGSGEGWRWLWPAGAVVGMVAADPRLAPPVRAGAACVDAMAGATGGGGAPSREQAEGEAGLDQGELRRRLRLWPEGGDWAAGAATLWSRAGPPGATTAGCTASTSASTTVAAAAPPPQPLPPLTQQQAGAARRAARQQLLACGGAASASASAAAAAPLAPAGRAASFSLLLIRRAPPPGDAGAGAAAPAEGGGWSVVLPAGWVGPLWLALAFTGARPTGQSEWRQLAAHSQVPCFPYDFPYTPAGERYGRERFQELAAEAARRPLGRARAVDMAPAADWGRLLQPLDLGSAGEDGGTGRPAPLADWSLALRDGLLLAPQSAARASGGRQPQRQQVQRRGQRGQQRQGGTAMGPAPAKSSLHGWTLRKALRLGLVSSAQPPEQPPPPPLPPLSVQRPRSAEPREQEESREATNLAPDEQQQLLRGGQRWLVHIALRVQGRGVCLAGAEVVALYGNGDVVCGTGDPYGAVREQEAAAEAGAGKVGRPGHAVLIGHVTSASPRGSRGYPGGLAVCDALSLASLQAQQAAPLQRCQQQQQQQQRGQDSCLPRRAPLAGGCGDSAPVPARDVVAQWLAGRGGGGKAHRGVVRVWVRNPGSPELRACVGRVLVEREAVRGDWMQLAWG
ncbi:hypothetical protein TSOC_005340 [Tetrabaena socialis]|uniref:POPLD domain-containing protein n=1 Tax=Tetrabaena socialis TaxID=47790 RepID=A0A2J8A6M9_9CHLO|nr:hypothetical protein TSOC_005340 [Tetrabaena socialis]|eukprot:PNH08143.1 hypothetical protein TSOC_005340 [Tetrabaena socialis]